MSCHHYTLGIAWYKALSLQTQARASIGVVDCHASSFIFIAACPLGAR